MRPAQASRPGWWAGWAATAALLAAAAAAQERVVLEPPQQPDEAFPGLRGARWLRGAPPEPSRPGAVTLVVPRALDSEELRNDSAYLGELQRRYGERGLQVLVVLRRGPEAAALPAGEWSAAVAPDLYRAIEQTGGSAALLDRPSRLRWSGPLHAGVSLLIERLLDGAALPSAGERDLDWQLEALGSLEDHPTDRLRQAADDLIARNPRNPDGWSLRLLVAVERDGDLAAARRVAADACKYLALEALPLTRFVDAMVDTAPNDTLLLQEALMALVPVASAAPQDLRLQLTYLRVLGGLGVVREAERLAKRVAALVERRPAAQAAFAEAAVFGKNAQHLGQLALAAIEAARARDPEDSIARMIHYLVLTRTAAPPEQVAALREELIREARSSGSLNNQAWYLVTQEPFRGRFHTVALALAEQMLADGNNDFAEQDTIALCLFVNGRVEEAIELQEVAAKAAEQPNFERRLQRFRTAAAQRRR